LETDSAHALENSVGRDIVGRTIQPEDIIRGPFCRETVRVISVKPIGNSQLRIEAVGLQTNRFYNPILPLMDLDKIEFVGEGSFTFQGDAESLFLYLESHRIRNAFQFDPLYAVSVSQINPLPHQIDAVYHYILPNPRIRFLLADDPGAGKTIMSGLLIKELKYRGLVDRTLIVVPGHLKDQWQREMKEKFQETFVVIDRGTMGSAWGQNQFNELSQVIVSLDFAKQEDVMRALGESHWDLCFVDEGHKMAAYRYGEKVSETQRYRLGKTLSNISSHLMILTATPHRGDPENFRLLLDLLEPGFFADTELLAESIENKDNPLFLRRLKEDLKDFDGTPLFPPRKVETIKYSLTEDEKALYRGVTKYVEGHFNRALQKEKRNVAFALTVLQRRLASSTRAIRKSLERRHAGLQKLLETGKELQNNGPNYYDDLDDMEERERSQIEEELLQKLTSSETLDELKVEIDLLEGLVTIARDVEKKEVETKLTQLKKLMDVEDVQKSGTKLLIFTESKDTLEYLVEKLKKWGYEVAFIHGGMNLDQRIQAEADFRNSKQIMVSTEAGGEGINLQFCWLMVNYDIPWNPNRLEQRMGRVHRYGQKHEVHVYNLVAVDTVEGKILETLFEKLETIRQNLGSDRVFDVMGDVLIGTNLKDLIMEAIANPRTMDDILKDIIRIPDEEAVERAKEASMESLATRNIDFTKVLGEQRTALENKLVPEYIEEYFKRAIKPMNLKMEQRQDGFWRIPSVPMEVRSQTHEFKLRYGDVQREYLKIGFDKKKSFDGQAEFISMSHPLLEAVVTKILKDYEPMARMGAAFADPSGQMDGTLWFLEAEIRDGKGDLAGKRLFTVYQSAKEGILNFINPSILWDLKPYKCGPECEDKPDIVSIIEFAVNGLDTYKEGLLKKRLRDADIKTRYGIKSLELLILDSEAKRSDYETRRMKGENIPDAVLQNEKRKREDLGNKLQRLSQNVEAETQLYPTEPKVIGAIRVIPTNEIGPDMVSNKEIEAIGMEEAMKFERQEGREPIDVSLQNLGYDIRSFDGSGKYRYIEVKARARDGAVTLTPNEWMMAQRLKEEYWLYIVINAASRPELYSINNPQANLQANEEISIVRYVVYEWKDKGKREW
jgi:superfamily II DNA or RNA helicase